MLPHNSRDAAPLVPVKFLPLHNIVAAVVINGEHASDKPVVIPRATVEVRGQKTYLARHHAVEDEVDGDDVLLALVAKDHLFPAEHHRRSLLHLHSTAGMAGTSATPVRRRRSDNVNEGANQALHHDAMTGLCCDNRTRSHGNTLSNGLLFDCWGVTLYRRIIAQGGETRLLATIHRRRAGSRRTSRASQNGVTARTCRHVLSSFVNVHAPHSHAIMSE